MDTKDIKKIAKTLDKALIILDIETSGISVIKDETVQFAAYKINPDGTSEMMEMLIKPSFPIPDEVIKIHGISNEDVADALPFQNYAKDIVDFIGDGYIAGYNIDRFDMKMLNRQLKESGLKPLTNATYDAYQVYLKHSPRKLADALKFYCNEAIEKAHDAMGDAITTLKVIVKQLENDGVEIKDACRTDDGGDKFFTKKDGDLYLAFGKHKGTKLKEADKGYLKWIVSKSEMPQQVKDTIKEFV